MSSSSPLESLEGSPDGGGGDAPAGSSAALSRYLCCAHRGGRRRRGAMPVISGSSSRAMTALPRASPSGDEGGGGGALSGKAWVKARKEAREMWRFSRSPSGRVLNAEESRERIAAAEQRAAASALAPLLPAPTSASPPPRRVNGVAVKRIGAAAPHGVLLELEPAAARAAPLSSATPPLAALQPGGGLLSGALSSTAFGYGALRSHRAGAGGAAPLSALPPLPPPPPPPPPPLPPPPPPPLPLGSFGGESARGAWSGSAVDVGSSPPLRSCPPGQLEHGTSGVSVHLPGLSPAEHPPRLDLVPQGGWRNDATQGGWRNDAPLPPPPLPRHPGAVVHTLNPVTAQTALDGYRRPRTGSGGMGGGHL